MADGMIGIRVIPDAQKFRTDLKKVLERAERTMRIKLDVDLSRAQRTMAGFRAEIARTTEQISVAVDTGSAQAEIAALTRPRDTDVSVSADTRRASAALAALSRARVAPIVPKVSKRALAQVTSTLAGISGSRLMQKKAQALGDTLANIDKAIPAIALTTTKVAAIGAVSLSSLSGVLSLGAGLSSIGGAGLALPGILAGSAVGMTALVLAMKDAGTQLGSLAPQFKALQDSVSAAFWDKAKAPIIDMVNTVLPNFKAGMTDVADAIGQQFGAIAGTMKTAFSADVIGPMMDNLRESINEATPGLQSMIEAFTTLGGVGSKYLTPLAQSFSDLMERFNQWVHLNEANGNLMGWIDQGIRSMKDLGSVVSGVVGIFKGLTKASEAAGGGNGLARFAETLHDISDIVNGGAFQEALTTLFTGAGNAMRNMGKALKPIGDMFVQLAPTISSAMETVGSIIGRVATELAAAFSQPEFKNGFSDLVNGIAAGIEGLLPAIKPLGKMMGTLGTFVGKLATSLGQMLGKSIEALSPIFSKLLEAIQPLIPVLTEVVLNIIKASEPLLEAFVDIIKAAAPVIGKLAQALVPLVEALMPPLVKLFEAFVPMIEKLTPLIEPLGKMFVALAESLGEMLGPIIEKLPELMDPMVDLSESMIELFTELAPLVSDILVPALKLIIPIFKQMVEKVDGFVESLTGVIEVVRGLVEGDWGAVWEGFGKIFSGAWDSMTAGMGDALGKMSESIGPALEGISAGWAQGWNGLTSFLSQTWQNIGNNVAAAMGGVGSFISQGVEKIRAGWSAGWQAVGSTLARVWQGITANVGRAIEITRATISTVLGKIQGIWSSMWRTIGTTLSGVWSGIKANVSGAISGVKSTISSALGTIRSTWTTVWSSIRNYVSGAFTGIVSSVSTGIGNVMRFFRELPGKIASALSGLAGRLSTIGVQMIQGLVNGIGSMAGSVTGKIGDIVNGAINGAKSLLGIHSPSRVFLAIGNYLGIGFGNGIAGTAKQVRAATGKLVQETTNAFAKRTDLVKKSNDKIKALEKKLQDTTYKAATQSQKAAIRRTALAGKKVADAQKRVAKAQAKVKGAKAGKPATTAKKELAAAKKSLEVAKRSRTDAKFSLKGAAASAVAHNKKIKAQRASLKEQIKSEKAAKRTYGSMTKGAEAKLIRQLTSQQKQLDAVAVKRDAVVAKLKTAKTNLDSLQKERAKYEGDIIADLTGSGDVTKMGASANSIIKNLAKVRDRIRTFAIQITQLRSQGLNADAIDQIVQSGAQAGSATAAALLKGGADAVKQVNALQGQIGSAAKSVGTTAGDAMFKSGVQAAQGIVKGLQSQQAALDKQAAKIGLSMAASVKKALGIHSPSRLFRDEVGVMMARGIIVGAESEGPAIDRAMRSLVQVPGVGDTGRTGTRGDGRQAASMIQVYTSDPYEAAKQVARLQDMGAM